MDQEINYLNVIVMFYSGQTETDPIHVLTSMGLTGLRVESFEMVPNGNRGYEKTAFGIVLTYFDGIPRVDPYKRRELEECGFCKQVIDLLLSRNETRLTVIEYEFVALIRDILKATGKEWPPESRDLTDWMLDSKHPLVRKALSDARDRHQSLYEAFAGYIEIRCRDMIQYGITKRFFISIGFCYEFAKFLSHNLTFKDFEGHDSISEVIYKQLNAYPK